MKSRPQLFIALFILVLMSLACAWITGLPDSPEADKGPTGTPTVEPTETLTPTPLPPRPVQPGADHPDEPVFIHGDIPYTNPFFADSLRESFVLLEDQAGFVRRDRKFTFSLEGQAMGPVIEQGENLATYQLALPAIPQGTQVDVDNDGEDETGTQVFAVAYWSNTWGGPFLELRDGTGWSTAYASTVSDPDQDGEIVGGTLVVWAPDGDQGFPTGFGPDGKLFTPDDPAGPIPAGYSLVDLDETPFKVYKEARPTLTLLEGNEGAVKDYSELDYSEAFEAMFEKVSREYPFTEEKDIDWGALHDEYAPRIERARSGEDFYRAMIDFTNSIPDAHIGFSSVDDNIYLGIFGQRHAGGFGLLLAELDDGRVIVTKVLSGTAGDRAGLQAGSEIVAWDGQPVEQAIAAVQPFFGPSSTEHHRRLQQLAFLTHIPVGERVEIRYKNPGETQEQRVNLEAEFELDSLFGMLSIYNQDELTLPIEGEILNDSGLAYIRIASFSGDDNLSAQIWDQLIKTIVEAEVPGLILDVRHNSGGNPWLALDIAGYFFEEEIELFQGLYLNDQTGAFEPAGLPESIRPGPLHFEGPVAVLVGPDCVSACEGFAYAMAQEERAVIIGHFPSAGAFGEVGRGQYDLPEKMGLQFPTGRPETPEGELVIEGEGVAPDITVPVTEESALGKVDAVQEEAIETLLKEIEADGE